MPSQRDIALMSEYLKPKEGGGEVKRYGKFARENLEKSDPVEDSKRKGSLVSRKNQI